MLISCKTSSGTAFMSKSLPLIAAWQVLIFGFAMPQPGMLLDSRATALKPDIQVGAYVVAPGKGFRDLAVGLQLFLYWTSEPLAT